MSASILVVDDSLTVRMNLVDLLETAGLSAASCATAAAARQAMAQNRFALIMLDVLLPDGDGVDLLREIRESPETIATPVILLSSEAEVRHRIRGLTTGADEYIGKPYEPTYVIARARELLRRGQADAPPRETILIIDDSVTFREELRHALEAASYGVLVAGTGEDGLQLAADMRPSGIIVDGQLPGIDGATVIKRIRLDAALRGMPCVLLTGADDQGEELKALAAGADAFIRKDDEAAVVLARLNAVLRNSAAQMRDAQTASLLGPKKILAVDDSETYLQELAGILRGDGYELVLARSGEEALALLAVQPVDCVLLDVVMPGLDGHETCRRLKEASATRDIPVIMLTAIEDRDAMILGLGAGADDYIAKSSDFEVLRARVVAQIRRKQFEDENRRIREQLLCKELEAAEARAARELALARAGLVEELESKNRELEAFSYSVAHDLRAPLRSIDGFSRILLKDHAASLNDEAQEHLGYIRESAQRMARLIDDLLSLSRVIRSEFQRERVDLSAIAANVVARLQRDNPDRQVQAVIARPLVASGDVRLLTIALENLIGNAWKFTGKRADARIEVAYREEGGGVFMVRDNGAGFDMTYASKLFGVFQRLHTNDEFEGTGIGLATVQRIVRRHGGRIWAEGEIGKGATFFFTLEEAAPDGRAPTEAALATAAV